MSDPAVVCQNITFGFDDHRILNTSSFIVDSGIFAGIMGPNGGGKTTLLKLLMGFLQPQSGSIQLLGKTPIQARPFIGYVPQVLKTDRDFPITLEEIVKLGALADPAKEIHAEKWMQCLKIESMRNKPFGTLSGGIAQRALLARALTSDPQILLLDEPTASIDPPSTSVIFEILESLKGEKTILLVTHDIKTIIERVDQILCVQGVINSYKPGEICEHFALGLYHTPLLDLPPNHWD